MGVRPQPEARMKHTTQPLPADVDPCDVVGHGHRTLQLDEARELILANVAPVDGHETLPLRDALGRVLCTAVRSTVDVPAHINSAMDGYALAGADLPAEGERAFEVLGTSWAGRPFEGAVAAGQCARIMTGATLPAGTDTVVMQEHVRIEDGRAVIAGGHRPGQNRREAGEDIRAGEVAVEAGTLLRPAQLGLIASVGVGRVDVRRRPRVAIFSTGDELRGVGESLGPGQIYDSNRYSLYGMVARLGLEVVDLGVVRDTPEATLAAFEEAAARADAIVTSGGVSVGEADFVVETLERFGRVGFWKVAMKPGKPIAFGHVRDALFFGLPGNPVSAMVTFYQLVQPALQALSGAVPRDPPLLLDATCQTKLKKKAGRLEFQRGILERGPDGRYLVRGVGHQGAGVLRSMAEANCFIVLPLEQETIQPGADVQVQPFAGLI
jgi:molybdopterin molybdotransferase